MSRRIGSLLIELGYLKPDELSRAVERQASAIVLNAIEYRTGSYTIEFTSNFPDEIVTLPLSTERLILDGVRRIDYWSLIVRGIGRMDRLLEAAPDSDRRTYQLELNGPAGGRWVSGAGGEEIVMDAADFCRLVSGRIGSGGQPAGLLATQVPF